MNQKTIKIVLSILLLLCLAPMPYGYYELVRWISAVAFAYLGYSALEQNEETLPWVFFGLAILFQPFIKIALGRDLWNLVDVVVAAFLVWTMVKRKNVK
jgi:hypothetical protein